MARQTLTAAQANGPWPALADAVTVTATAADATNFEQTVLTGRELLIARNSGATGRVCTITSVADPNTKRTGDIVETVPTGELRLFGPFALDGFKQTDGMLYFQAAHAEILWSVIRF